MPLEIVNYVNTYGYLAIFVMVFLQETGFPVPVPNELLLLFSGYLTFKGILFLPFVILTVFAADLIGTNILYFIFLKSGSVIIDKKPKWFPISDTLIKKLREKISVGGSVTIFIFRLTPFTRGYASVISGLLQIKPGIFLPIAIYSAAIWASVYIFLGHFLAPSWNLVIKNLIG
jgi:membrane protein DedA with SNARE-associated domain